MADDLHIVDSRSLSKHETVCRAFAFHEIVMNFYLKLERCIEMDATTMLFVHTKIEKKNDSHFIEQRNIDESHT